MESNFNPSRLAECRKKLGLTKQQAAVKTGLSQPTYLRYENGDRVPSIHVIKTLAERFETSVDYLTGTTSDPSPNFYTISKESNKDLFLLVERCRQDPDFMTMILSYISAI